MGVLGAEISTRELRSNLADVIGEARHAGHRFVVTRNGKPAAAVVSIADLQALEDFEMAEDVAAYRQAKREDDGQRVTLEELKSSLD
ncbi:prevent-host-death family protein [Mobiluncus mulieris 28-1]|uniref:Antitoxin n=1 Tax=Mobiluncus mulieris TaxID=2052 RepID=A0A7Y0U3F6_9ACTO|nr:type II toxin-antitoxin system Phd/YefM family antitoxin [Mobiluncus mulieris]EEZ90435.1 prevent-host-death family protein [Mobiluncus mulieris 28-1]NMW66082.1 type II toxin-antitoxin system Phd/YefM family antitoxin [Mobiluncus mulieris]NMX04203.1 type II toxin-antitoxin system Phd/YefM family antitoxin [Mobiluncus mulieris]NMX12564.1 type II toxin-antitoxin system Phd/YefM family antitoxin [Mobiluncus mulieris]